MSKVDRLPQGLRFGHQDIDDQHAELIAILEELVFSLNEKKVAISRDDRLKALDKLIKYSELHFPFEEAKMHRFDYPDVIEHIAQHRLYDKMVHDLLIAKTDVEFTKLCSMAVFIKKWLKGHIETHDKKFVTFLKDHEPDAFVKRSLD